MAMGWGNHRARIREMFADQFEPLGTDFAYRRSNRGAPIRVSAAERDRFVEDFQRLVGWMMWGLLAAMMLMVVGFVAAGEWLGIDDQSPTMYGAMTLILVAYIVLWFHCWNAPARALAGRAALGPKRTRAEAQQAYLAKTGWGQLIGSGLFLGLFMLKLNAEHDLMHGWARLWLVFGAVVAVLFSVQVFRKWQLDNRA